MGGCARSQDHPQLTTTQPLILKWFFIQDKERGRDTTQTQGPEGQVRQAWESNHRIQKWPPRKMLLELGLD